MQALKYDHGADMADLTSRIAERALSIEFERLPSGIADIAKHCLLDWIGVSLAGWNEPLVSMLVQDCEEEGGNGVATLLGCGRQVTARQAALVNGSAGHALDFDDVHLPSRVHPSAAVWPATLAIAEQHGFGGKELVAAFIAGVEAQSSIAAFMGQEHYRHGWHNTATLGAFGATLAACRLFRMPLDQSRHAMGIVATQAAGLRAVFGTMCKPLHAGHAAACGIRAAKLASRGYKSHPSILECDGGFVSTYGGFVWPQERAETYLHASDIIFKYHASCYGTHAPIEAALRLKQRFDCAVPRISSVDVCVEPQYLTVCNIEEPVTASEGKFSIRHAVALALAGYDTAAAESFAENAITRPTLVELRRKIVVRGSENMPRAHAEVMVTLKDGNATSEHFDASVPEVDHSRQRMRLEGKFRSLLGAYLAADCRDRIVDSCRRLETIDDVRLLLSYCRITRSAEERQVTTARCDEARGLA